jgi:predicted NAD-dependent protein-ADP-ribosyltransferase YbiA (DUF1768 family)
MCFNQECLNCDASFRSDWNAVKDDFMARAELRKVESHADIQNKLGLILMNVCEQLHQRQ